MQGYIANVRDMETATNNRDLWTEVTTKLSWSLRADELPAGRFRLERETLQKLLVLLNDFAGSDDPKFLESTLTGPRTNAYVTGAINSLFAFKHLSVALRSDIPLVDLHCALRGLLPECDRLHAVDFSTPELFESSRPEMEAVMGILGTGSYFMESEFLIRTSDGSVMLTKGMKALVARHPDKAASMAGLIHTRNFDSTNINAIEELLDNAAAPLLEGTL
jgi:hypothetical protein